MMGFPVAMLLRTSSDSQSELDIKWLSKHTCCFIFRYWRSTLKWSLNDSLRKVVNHAPGRIGTSLQLIKYHSTKTCPWELTWIQNITGSFWSEWPAGRHTYIRKISKTMQEKQLFLRTFRKRQSSLMGAPRFPGGWGQAFPNVVASLSAEERFVMATGALNLNSPTGGSAKGIPSHFSTSPFGVDDPRKVPVCKWMSKFWAVLVLRLSKRVESPRKHREIMINYLRKNRSPGFASEERPYIGRWWEIEANMKKHYSS